jgi:general stress protein 26
MRFARSVNASAGHTINPFKPGDRMTESNPDDIKKLAKLIKGIRIAMLTTTEHDGTLRSRPMATQQHEFDGDLWFFTAKSSHKVVEIGADYHVNLSYADPSDNRYVSISGTAELVTDRQKAEELWNPILKAWFPKGLEDPDLALLKVTPTQAEYWDSPSSGVVHAIGFVKAILTGHRANPGDHARVNLH